MDSEISNNCQRKNSKQTYFLKVRLDISLQRFEPIVMTGLLLKVVCQWRDGSRIAYCKSEPESFPYQQAYQCSYLPYKRRSESSKIEKSGGVLEQENGSGRAVCALYNVSSSSTSRQTG